MKVVERIYKYAFLPRDAMRKRVLAVGRCPSVRPSRSRIVSRRLKISSNFILTLVTYIGKGLLWGGSATPPPQGTESERSQFRVFFSIYAYPVVVELPRMTW